MALACAGAGGAFATAARASAGTAPDCRQVKLVGVRGSGDTSSSLGVIATALSGRLAAKANSAGVGYAAYGIPYTAVGIAWYKLTNIQVPQYRLSVRDGRKKLYAFLHAQAQSCPHEKLAVVGYSQGAQVVGDIFSKGLGRLTSSELAHVVAVLLVADPRFNSKEPYDHGSFRTGRNGLLGARSPGDLTSVSSRLGAWCRKDDLVCQGPGTTGNHDQAKYLADYEGAMASFLAERLGLAAAGGGTQPYPPGTRDLGFHSADGNVGCWIERDASRNRERRPQALTTRCVVKQRSWTPHWVDCRDISPIEYFYVTPTAVRGTHAYGCAGGVPWNLDATGTLDPWHAQLLAPNQSISAAGFRCLALSAAEIRCTNTAGHGFVVGRAAYSLL
jgi:hypothetical protein